MGFKGSVDSFSLADVFQNLSMNQQTGTLRVFTSDGNEKQIYFISGQVKHLSRGLRKPLIADEVYHARGLVLANTLEHGKQCAKETG